MIPLPSGARVWLATGHTDMRKGYQSLALLVQETLKRDPHGGHLFVFRGRRGDLIKCLWHDGKRQCLFSKRLERGRFLWPSPADGVADDERGPTWLSPFGDRLARAAIYLATWKRSADRGIVSQLRNRRVHTRASCCNSIVGDERR